MFDGSVVIVRRGEAAPPELTQLRQRLLSRLGTERPAWPRVAKNASGYALDAFLPTGDGVDLLVGSEGTLGIVTEVRLRLAPQPPERAMVLLPMPDRQDLPHAVDLARAIRAAACEFFDGRFLDMAGLRTRVDTAGLVADAPALVLLELEGHQDEVEQGLRRSATFAGDLGVPVRVGRSAEERTRLWAIRHSASPVVAAQAARGLVSMQFIEDSVVRVDLLPAYLSGIEVILTEEQTDAVVFGHTGDGNVHVNPLVDVTHGDWRDKVRRILNRTVDLVVELGGTLSGEHGDGRLRGSFHLRIFGEPVADAFRHVKETLDPRGILNPGAVVPLPGQDPLEGITPLRRYR
jgi:FAD/FMN-containing dehydrogenase